VWEGGGVLTGLCVWWRFSRRCGWSRAVLNVVALHVPPHAPQRTRTTIDLQLLRKVAGTRRCYEPRAYLEHKSRETCVDGARQHGRPVDRGLRAVYMHTGRTGASGILGGRMHETGADSSGPRTCKPAGLPNQPGRAARVVDRGLTGQAVDRSRCMGCIDAHTLRIYRMLCTRRLSRRRPCATLRELHGRHARHHLGGLPSAAEGAGRRAALSLSLSPPSLRQRFPAMWQRGI